MTEIHDVVSSRMWTRPSLGKWSIELSSGRANDYPTNSNLNNHVTQLGSAASGIEVEAILVDDVHELFHRILVH